jgi:hypothetical protein
MHWPEWWKLVAWTSLQDPTKNARAGPACQKCSLRPANKQTVPRTGLQTFGEYFQTRVTPDRRMHSGNRKPVIYQSKTLKWINIIKPSTVPISKQWKYVQWEYLKS